ncbi:hypothetical protein NG831_06590 [Xanthomonas sacchari]|uniref:hypothetical protein n=1 Tax=Xanthomonas sacchari TaxID=56458 RepID=UPI00225095B6|nr:hypothetical protein [Xanthomonas sacchari]MCW0413471.1 hypothetical protein [Xanthomonas sacchari]UYK67828.1 hypothetical protein NG831_06590 [Xanthomonas sacchari]
MTQLDAMEKMVSEIREALQRRSDPAPKNVNTVRIEGMGAMWNGIAIGIALGAVIVATGWNVSKQQENDMRIRQAESYKAAVYMLAPRFAEEIDKELRRSAEDQKEADKL